MRFAGRFSKPGERYHGLVTIGKNKRAIWTGEGRLDSGKLAKPLHWKKPRRIFVNSMSDLFYEEFTNEQIAAVFGVMAACPRHTFQVLTKRARRMREWFQWVSEYGTARALRRCGNAAEGHGAPIYKPLRKGRSPWNDATTTWPPPNIWLGVSVENQEAADERIPYLVATPAAVRFLSCEPLLDSLDLRHVQHERTFEVDALTGDHGFTRPLAGRGPGIDWVIAGCESGPGARPCQVDWLRSLRDQCRTTGVRFFLKQATVGRLDLSGYQRMKYRAPDAIEPRSGIGVGPGSKNKAGGVIGLPYLDGVQHAEFPSPREI
jgi:protein gp37